MNDGNAQIQVRRTGQVDLHGHSSGPIECRYLGPPHGVVKVQRSRWPGSPTRMNKSNFRSIGMTSFLAFTACAMVRTVLASCRET